MKSHSTRNEDMHDLDFTLNIGDHWHRDQMQIVILCDIRRELKRLNSLLHCPNFTDIPNVLRGIRRNTHKVKRRQRVLQTRPKKS